jgi:O-antigen/teichoic acid export membrane protein
VFGMGVDGIVIGFIVGDAASLLISVYGLRPIIFASRLSREIRALFRYSLPLYASYILNFLSVNIDYYLILSLSGLSTAGIYSPAVFFATLLVTALAALEQALLPFFSRIYGKSGLGTLENLSHVISRYIFLIYFPMGFAILASAPLIISEILGERYIGSILPSMTLILAITLTSIGTVFNNILKSAGHSNIFLTSTIGALSVQLLVSLITLPSLGALGAALARSCAYTTLFITPAYKLKRVSRLHYDRIALRKGLIGSIVMASIIFVLNSYSPNPWYLSLNLFGGLISYLVFLRFVRAMDIKDFETLDNILLGKLKWPIRLTMKIVLR